MFVFEDPFALTVEDYIDDNGKMRFQTIGMISDHMLINVAHVYRVIEDHETPWIISARKAVKYEKDTYQNHRRNEA